MGVAWFMKEEKERGGAGMKWGQSSVDKRKHNKKERQNIGNRMTKPTLP